MKGQLLTLKKLLEKISNKPASSSDWRLETFASKLEDSGSGEVLLVVDVDVDRIVVCGVSVDVVLIMNPEDLDTGALVVAGIVVEVVDTLDTLGDVGIKLRGKVVESYSEKVLF